MPQVQLARVFALLGLLLMACATAPDDDRGQHSSLSPANCLTNETVCGEVCANLTNNSVHCGACGNSCALGESCTNGTCNNTCWPGEATCSGDCVNLQSDAEHCGGCGVQCASGQVCSLGKCADACDEELTACGPDCVRLSTDPANCGSCGFICAIGESCHDGACEPTCGDGLTRCGESCIDLQTHPEHCGACGTNCTLEGLACVTGKCDIELIDAGSGGNASDGGGGAGSGGTGAAGTGGAGSGGTGGAGTGGTASGGTGGAGTGGTGSTGSGGTGGNPLSCTRTNLALSATATASSYSTNYPAAFVNDGIKNTSLNAWANAYNAALPQWVELTWPTNQSVGRVDIHMTATANMKAFRVEVWNGANYDVVADVTNNLASIVKVTFPRRSTSRVRVVALQPSGLAGPQVFVREIEVFANHAATATPSAQSTFSGYSVAAAKDGDRDVALGGDTSWANDKNVSMPQWYLLDFGGCRAFDRIEIFTTEKLELRDFDVQVFDGVEWKTKASITQNTATSRTIDIGLVSASQLRILAKSGPTVQPGYARLNEVEVY